MLQGRRGWFILAALFISAFWPRLFDMDTLPEDAPAGYRQEALDTWWWMHDNPVQQIWFGLLTQNFVLSGWERVAGSCDGGSTTWPHIRDVRVTVTALGPWGIALSRSTITCGGAGYHSQVI
jgi:predicted nucleic acid-binding Zn ribbon protein